MFDLPEDVHGDIVGSGRGASAGFLSRTDAANFRTASSDANKMSAIGKRAFFIKQVDALNREKAELAQRLLPVQRGLRAVGEDISILMEKTRELESIRSSLLKEYTSLTEAQTAIENRLLETKKMMKRVVLPSPKHTMMFDILHSAGTPMHLIRAHTTTEPVTLDIPGAEKLTVQNIRDLTPEARRVREQIRSLNRTEWTAETVRLLRSAPLLQQNAIGVLKYLMLVAPFTDKELLAAVSFRVFNDFDTLLNRMAPDLIAKAKAKAGAVHG